MNPPARNNKQNTPQLFDNNNELELDDDDNINSNLSSSINNIQQHQQNQDSSQQQISTENTVIVEYDLDSPISPLDENEPIDFSLVYALHTFVANLEGQVCVLKGDSLELLDDSNSYWWLVKCLKTEEIGYIPAENIETPHERLARLNRQRNIKIAEPNHDDIDPETLPPKIGAKKLAFASEPLIIYEDGEIEEGIYMDDPDHYVAAVPDEDLKWKTENQSKSSSRASNITKAFRNSFVKKILGKTKKERPDSSLSSSSNLELNTESEMAVVDVSSLGEPISVLRIFAGNVDLKATFKTVAMTQKDMTGSELLSAALKRFRVENANPNEFFLSYLHMDSQEKRINENEVVKDLLEGLRHKTLPGVGDLSKTSHAVMKQGKMSSVKMNDDNIVKILINKKLNLFEKNYHLMRVFMIEESDLPGTSRYKTIGVDGDTTVSKLIEIAQKKFKVRSNDGYKYSLWSDFKNQEIERSGDEIIRNILQMAKGSVDDIDFILKREWTGEFNENLQGDVLASSSPNSEQAPAPTDVEGMLKWKPSFLEDFPQNEAATVVITPASVAPIESNKPPSRSPSYNSGTGGGPQIRARTDSLIYAADNRPTPPSVDKALPVVGATSNYNNSISKSRSNQSLIQPDGGSKLSVPVRQGSLPAPSNNGNINSSSNSTNNANNQALMNLKMSMSRELAQLSRNNSENRKSVRSIDSPTSASRSRNSVGKKNFEYMEDYLEEMIRGTGNKEKVEYLESILQVAGNNSNSSPLQRNIPQSPSVSSGYNDSGLSKLLSKTSPSTAVSRRPTSTGSGGVGQDRKKKRPNSTSSNDQTSSALRNVFQDMEADIESTLKRTTTKSSSAAPMTENNNHYSPPRLVTSASTTTSRSVMEAGLKSKLSLSEDIVLPLDKYRESEDLLGSLQRDLDSILNSAVKTFNLS